MSKIAVAYYKFENLPKPVKKLNKIRSEKRVDCTHHFNPLHYNGLTNFVNKNKQIFFYVTDTTQFSSSFQKSDVALTQSGYNFSSIIYDCEGCNIGYGYPNPKPKLANGSINPLYKHRNDGYIFIHNDDYSKLELLVFPFKKYVIESIYNHIIDGYFDEQLEYIQGASKVFYEYIPKDA